MKSTRLFTITVIFLMIWIGIVEAQEFLVKTVLAADRFKLENAETIRLIGVDVPETRKNDRAINQGKRLGVSVEAVNNMGVVAALFVKSMIEGKKVLLEFDQQKKDQSGFKPAYVFVRAPKDIKESDYSKGVIVDKGDDEKYFFLNALLIDLDYARPRSMSPNKKFDNLFFMIDKDKEENADPILNALFNSMSEKAK